MVTTTRHFFAHSFSCSSLPHHTYATASLSLSLYHILSACNLTLHSEHHWGVLSGFHHGAGVRPWFVCSLYTTLGNLSALREEEMCLLGSCLSRSKQRQWGWV